MGLFAIRFGASRFFRTRIARKFSFDVTVRMILRELNKLCRVSKCLNRFCQRFCNCSNVRQIDSSGWLLSASPV